MKDISIHPIEYLRVHLDYEEIWTRLLTSLGSFLKKVFESAGKVVVAVTVLLITSLFVFIFMQLVEYGSVTSCFYDVITSMVVPPIEAIPMGM